MIDISERESLAACLAERIALDPHTVDEPFFAHLKQIFSDEEIIEMVFACGIFNWGNKFNITMHMDADGKSDYQSGLPYREEKLA